MSRDESRRSKRSRPDRDFELGPDARILMGDYDDERTLDEEEALEGSEDTHNELSHLQKESDMPLKDLLVMYGYGMDSQDPDKAEDDDEEEDDEEEDDDDDDDEDEDDEEPNNYEPDLKQFYTEMVKSEENGENTKKTIAKASDSVRTAETEALELNVNAHLNTNSTEIKVEDSRGVSNVEASESNLGDDLNPNIAVDGNPNVAGPTQGTNVSSGGNGGSSSRLLRSVSRPQSEEEEEDGDYTPDEEEWKKTIMVGSDYQAAIPEGLCKYDDALPYENEDKMLWDPSPINEDQIEEFLERAQQPAVKGVSLPRGSHVRDDEQALYLLLQCGYNLEEALRRRRMNVVPSTESISIWSEEECHNFETGVRVHGKDFYSIHKHKVRTRSVGELVQFYYLWKKTERHDIFTHKSRLEKKKYSFHPGVTDYMDRFLEEQEGVRDRSSSPNVNYLMHTDKRQRIHANSTCSEEPGTGIGKPNLENWEMDSSIPNKASPDSWNAGSANPSAATAGSMTPSMPTSGSSSSSTETSTRVNSDFVDSHTQDHQNSSTSAVAAASATSQHDFVKANSSAGVESNASCAAVTPWPSSNTSTNTTIASISSSSTSVAAPMPHQQQQQLTNLSPNKSNENDAALIKARTPENILPHLPP